MYDHKKLTVIDVVVLFSWDKNLPEVGAGVKVPVRVLLHENSFRGSEGGICHDKEGFSVVRESKHGFF